MVTILGRLFTVVTCLSIILKIINCNANEPWNAYVLPPNFNPPINETARKGKQIPRNLWIGFKKMPLESELPHSLQDVISRARNDTWNVYFLGHEEQLAFMREYYPGTSILWAFEKINPGAGVSACDIWRYSVLYALGGFYMDDDAYITTSLEKVVEYNDTLIMSQERNRYVDCYLPTFHLSNEYMSKKYNFNSFGLVYGDKNLVNWGILSAPRHPVILRIMENVVDIVRKEYLRETVIHMRQHDAKWRMCMCATGPTALTATVREMFITHDANLSIRVTNKDFEEYGGVFKVNPKLHFTHYMIAMEKHRTPLLSDYVPFDVAKIEGLAITDGSFGLWVVQNGQKRRLPNYDTLCALNYTLGTVLSLRHDDFGNITDGPVMPALDFKDPKMC